MTKTQLLTNARLKVIFVGLLCFPIIVFRAINCVLALLKIQTNYDRGWGQILPGLKKRLPISTDSYFCINSNKLFRVWHD